MTSAKRLNQSIKPPMREGDVVIVRKQDTAETGDIVVVLINGDSATVKRIKKEPTGITLIPNNPAYDPMYYSSHDIETLPVRILGKVVELRAKF
ncbi:LexA family protein [Intestinimonas massiliensis (ex Afouda et al. 2020)]|uniref:LexA family protein n=1 Tax=Intestinimonas massiliensis (ex Afouda et al. 2020) TaxID=1673721 RepID=UPI00349F3848